MEVFMWLFEILGNYSTAGGLGDHLAGFGMAGDWNGAYIYNDVGFIITGVSLLLFILFYYGPFNRVKFSKVRHWLIFLVINIIIGGLVAYGYAVRDLPAEFHSKDLNITENDCIGFGISAALWAAIFLMILTVAGKWWSQNQSKNPF